MNEEINKLCRKILGTRWDILTEKEWKEIESLAFDIGHFPDILNPQEEVS